MIWCLHGTLNFAEEFPLHLLCIYLCLRGLNYLQNLNCVLFTYHLFHIHLDFIPTGVVLRLLNNVYGAWDVPKKRNML